MKRFLIFALGVIVILGCAKMQVGGTKEPIKVDISMRLDIYQHVQKDIDAIENIVTGGQDKNKENAGAGKGQSLLSSFVSYAYAEDGLSPEVEQAALRRRDRLAQLNSLESRGIVGENEAGFVVVRNSQGADASAIGLINAENSDRMIIYQAVAAKNNTPLGSIQKIYAQRLQSDAPDGAPIEVPSASGGFEWKIK